MLIFVKQKQVPVLTYLESKQRLVLSWQEQVLVLLVHHFKSLQKQFQLTQKLEFH